MEGRLNRRNWVYGMLIANIIVAFVQGFWGTEDSLIVVALLPGFFSLSLSVRRLHDVGRSGWFIVPNLKLPA